MDLVDDYSDITTVLQTMGEAFQGFLEQEKLMRENE